MQPCKTGVQPYSDASPNSECSLDCNSEADPKTKYKKIRYCFKAFELAGEDFSANQRA